MSSLMQKFEPNSRQTLVALMMFLGVVCLTGGVTAQSIIDFEQPDSSDAEACDFVTTQYQAQFGIRFENVDASGNPLDPPQFARVGGVSTWDGTSFTGCAYEGFPVGPFVNRSGGGFGSGVHLNHVSDCYFPADECSASFPTPDFVADYDTPVYDEGALPPETGTPSDALHDVGCWFLTAQCGSVPQGSDWDALRVIYDDDLNCTELSGVILDTDIRTNVPNPDLNTSASNWEIWEVTAFGPDPLNPTNITNLKTVRVYPILDPNGNEYWDDPNTWPEVPTDVSGGVKAFNGVDTTGDLSPDTVGHMTGDGSVRRFELRINDDPPSQTNRISYVELKQVGTGGSVGLGFDLFSPCSATEDTCTSTNEIVTCETNSPGTDYTLTFDLTNNSNNNVTQLVIPGQIGNSTITPNVINLPTVLQAGGVATGIELNISGGNAGDNLCIPVGLISTDSSPPFQCCSAEVCVELPSCCLAIIDENIFLEPTTGETTYAFAIENLPNEAPAIADHLFVNVIAPPGAQISPQWFPLNSLIDNSSQALPSSVISGVSPGDQICLQMTLHNDTLNECCGITHYTTVPSPLTAPIPTFIRGDANSDGSFDLSDVITGLGYLFQSQNSTCLSALDSNDDETIDIADAIFSLDALFGGGPSPWPPHQNCGVDETAGSLGCEYFPACEISGNGPQGG